MRRPHKYPRIERERRFLLDRFPTADVVRIRHITDRYIDGSRLRLREQTDDGGPTIFKLTQKVPARANGTQRASLRIFTSQRASFVCQLNSRKDAQQGSLQRAAFWHRNPAYSATRHDLLSWRCRARPVVNGANQPDFLLKPVAVSVN
jgi:hypothetical protein